MTKFKTMAIIDINSAIAYLQAMRDEFNADDLKCLDSFDRALNKLNSAMLNIQNHRKEIKKHGNIN